MKMGNWFFVSSLLLFLLQLGFAAPIAGGKKSTDKLATRKDQDMEYYRYIRQVFNELNKDPTIARALANITEDDMQSGGIIEHLDLAGHDMRKRLDEIKRVEIDYQHGLIRERKHHMAQKQGNEWNPVHHSNKETFEKEDLKKLMMKHRDMLEELENRRKKEFKEYEMDKEHQRREKMKGMNDAEKEEFMKSYNDTRNKQHETMHEPGSKAQLEEAWERDDHLDHESFDERTLFNLHDKNGDEFLDLYEVETMFLSEVDKVYNQSHPDTDSREREEELQLMAEHMMNRLDKNRDRLISLVEFMKRKDDPDYREDKEWKPITEEDQYTSDEMEEYEKEKYKVERGEDHKGE